MRKLEIPEWAFFWLGSIPDYAMAEMLGCTRETIMRCRKELGIPIAGAMNQVGDAAIKKQQQRDWANSTVCYLLVKLQSLDAVAREMGITKQRVHQIAQRTGCRIVRTWAAPE